MKTRIILNPGSREGTELEARIREYFRDRTEVDIVRTEDAGHAGELARKAVDGGFELLVAAGGDGTVNDVVNGLANRFDAVTLGVLPIGTGNDFARSLRMPLDLEGALDTLAKGETKVIDLATAVGSERSRWFANVAAGGFGGEVRENLSSELKDTWGPFAYFQVAVEHIPDRSIYEVELECSDGSPCHERALNVAIANGPFVAGGIPAAPYAELDDQVLDVVLVKDCGLGSLTALAPRVLVGNHLEDSEECIVFRQTQRVEVRSEPPMPWNLDGEPFGQGNLTFEIHPGALRVVVGEGP